MSDIPRKPRKASKPVLSLGLVTACALAAGLCAATAFAGHTTGPPPVRYGHWRQSKIGGGGYIQNVVISPSRPERCYAWVDVAGPWRSDDGAQSWRSLYGGLPMEGGSLEVRSLTVDPRDADRVLIATGSQWTRQRGGIYLSEDAGRTWRRTLEASFPGNGPFRWSGVVLARHPEEPDVLLAADAGNGVFRSTDGGLTWTNRGVAGVYATDLRFDPHHPSRAWLCAREVEVYISGERRSFRGGFYRSDDGGLAWQKLSDSSPTEILPDPQDPDMLYGLIQSRPHLSTDHGESWRRWDQGLPEEESKNPRPGRFQALAAGPGFVLTASTDGTFHRRRPPGAKWESVHRAGVDWTFMGRRWFHAESGFGSALASIVVDPHDPDHWFFTDWFAIYQTHDAGRHWELSIDGLECTVIHTLEQDRSDPDTVHLGMADNGYFYSENGAERFHNVGWQRGITNNVKCISVAPTRPSRLYATSTQTWEHRAEQAFVSDDGGRTWGRSPMKGLPPVGQFRCNSVVADPQDADTVYLGVSGEVGPGGGGVYRSGDGGRTWEWIGHGLPSAEGFFATSIWGIGREIAVGVDGTLLCISRDRSEVFRRAPSAEKWAAAEADLAGRPNCVVADPTRPGTFYLAADAVYRSTDGGQSWQNVLAETARHVAVDKMRPDRIAAGVAASVMLSEDGGEMWRKLDEGLPNPVFPVPAFAGDRLVVGTPGNGVFWIPLDHAPPPK